MEARFVERVGDGIKIKLENGRIFTLPLSRFSNPDQEYITSLDGLIAEPIARSARTFYLEDEAWPGYLKGGLIVLSVSGDVQTKAPPLEYVDEYDPKPPPKWKAPKKGDILVVGHQVQTGTDGKMELLLTNGTVTTILSNTSLLIKTFFQDQIVPEDSNLEMSNIREEISPSMVKLEMEVGELIVETKKLDKKSSFFIESQLGTAGIRGTAFRLSVNDKTLSLEVLRGQVDTLNKERQITSVINGQRADMSESESSTPSLLPDTKSEEIKNVCNLLAKGSAEITIGEIVEKQNEANPPIELIIDKNGFDYAMRKKIRRPRGKILHEDYDRVYRLHSSDSSELDDIRFLEKLKNLKRLYLTSTSISDLSIIKKLMNLEVLHLNCKKVTDFKVINKLKKIRLLWATTNQLQFFSNLQNLEHLHTKAGIEFKLLKNYPDLKILKIAYDGKLEEIKNFSNLQRLEELKLLYNPDKNPPISKQDLENLRNMLPDTKVTLTDRGW
jgi:hypothetical protein